jgi:hypothetical protein
MVALAAGTPRRTPGGGVSDAGLKLLANIEALMRDMVAQQKALMDRMPPLSGRQRAARAREKRKDTAIRNAPAALPVTQPVEEKVTHVVRDGERTKAPPLPVPSPSPSAPTSPSPFIPLPLGKNLALEPEKPDSAPLTRATWASFAAAYRAKYGVEPVRNETVNSQMAGFVRRIGREEAPLVAAFYVGHSAAKYAGHPVGMLTKDAEPLRMQWASGRKITGLGARQREQTQENVDSWAEHLSEEGRNALVRK